jgi:UDP-GlcNAc:undecaprenyl-phosphate GlcNAc-1-phosphate transferase
MINIPFFLLLPLTFFLTLSVSIGLRRLPSVPDSLGIGIFLAWSAALSFTPAATALDPGHLSLLATALFLVLTNSIADRQKSGAAIRLALMTGAAVMLVLWTGARIYTLGNIGLTGQSIQLGYFALPVSIFCALIILKAWDMSGSLHGQAEGLTLTALFWIVASAVSAGGDLNEQQAPLLLIAAVLGVLPLINGAFVKNKDTPHLGHTGSVFLGLAVAWLTLDLPRQSGFNISPITAAWIVALPVFDLAGTGLRRLAARENPFGQSKRHLHDLLLKAGYDERRAAQLILRLAFLYGGIGYLGWCWQVRETWMLGAWVGAFIVQAVVTQAVRPVSKNTL